MHSARSADAWKPDRCFHPNGCNDGEYPNRTFLKRELLAHLGHTTKRVGSATHAQTSRSLAKPADLLWITISLAALCIYGVRHAQMRIAYLGDS